MKGIMLSLGALAAAVMISPMSGSQVDAKTPESTFKYQVLTQNALGKQTSVKFKGKSDFEKYLKDNPVKGKIGTRDVIRSTFYEHSNGGGWSFTADASRNPTVIVNFGQFNDGVSSVRTHSYGDYTYIYEHGDAKGNALAMANNGGLYNLPDYALGDGQRNWNDVASSTIVRSK